MIKFPRGQAHVGQTKRALKQQISEHKTAFRIGNMEYAVAKHYPEALQPLSASLDLNK